MKVNLSKLAEKWPSAYVARDQVGKFSGGIISPQRIKNLDALGKGPVVRIRVGRRIAYPVAALIRFLEARAKKI
jgi:hypothetical protein